MALLSTLSGEDAIGLSGLGSLAVCSPSKCLSEDGLKVLEGSQPSFLSAEIWRLGEGRRDVQESHKVYCRQAEVQLYSSLQSWAWEYKNPFQLSQTSGERGGNRAWLLCPQ